MKTSSLDKINFIFVFLIPGEMKTTLDYKKLLIRKTISVDRIDACDELIRREAHTRFGNFLNFLNFLIMRGEKKRCSPRQRGRKLEHRAARSQKGEGAVVIFIHFFLLFLYNTYVF